MQFLLIIFMRKFMNISSSDDKIGLLLQAMQFSAHKHRSQHRKDKNQTPYINHPIQVAELLWNTGGVRDIETIIAALLHDTIEDTDTTAEEITCKFGSLVSSLVQEVSDDKSLPKQERKRLQIANAPHKSISARQIKLADKISNIGDINFETPQGWSFERKQEYIAWAIQVVAGLRGVNPNLEILFDQTVAKIKNLLEQINF